MIKHFRKVISFFCLFSFASVSVALPSVYYCVFRWLFFSLHFLVDQGRNFSSTIGVIKCPFELLGGGQ